MKLALAPKTGLQKFDKWFSEHSGLLQGMECEDIANEAFLAGMRIVQEEIDKEVARIEKLELGIKKAFKAGYYQYRETFDHYDDIDDVVEHCLQYRLAEYIEEAL